MLPAPAALTPERIDAMLARTAEICMAGVEEAGVRLAAAPDMESFERAGRTLQSLGRGLRQTLAMKQRFDREQVAVAQAQRRLAEDARKDAERAHSQAVGRHQSQVRRHFARVLWDEYEDDDAQEIFEDLEERLSQIGDDDAFLDTPVETLIARLTDELVAEPVEDAAPTDDEADDQSPEDDDPEPTAPETTAQPRLTATEPEAPIATAPEAPTDPAPPDPPPDLGPADPPPAPYIPPWELLPRGAAMPGGTGW